MGDYRVVIEAVGGHGCSDSRKVKEGETLAPPCGNDHCPDCKVRKLVSELALSGNSINKAEIQHWPSRLDHKQSTYDPANEVIDDLKTGTRSKGSFG